VGGRGDFAVAAFFVVRIRVVGRDPRRPSARIVAGAPGSVVSSAALAVWEALLIARAAELLFTETKLNHRRLTGGPNLSMMKDAFHEYLIGRDKTALILSRWERRWPRWHRQELGSRRLGDDETAVDRSRAVNHDEE